MIKHIMATTLLWLAIVAALPLYAQQQQEYTLGSLWSKVEENYPGVGAKMSAIDAAKYNQRAVKGNMLPQVNAQAQNTYGTYEGSAGGFFPQPGFFNVNGSVPLDGSTTAANTFGSAIVNWELFSFGKLRKQNEAAGALYDKSVSDKDAYVLNLKKILSERYITLLYNNAKLQWTKNNAERLNDIRKITSGLSASGLRPAADSLLASSSYVQAMGEYDKWNGFKNAAYIKLLELYGDDTVNYTASANRFDNPAENSLNKVNTINPSHPILDALDKQSEYYTLSGEAQKRSSLPSINLLGGYAYRGTGISPNGKVSGAWKDGFRNTTNNFLAGIGITWNLTSLHTNRMKGEQLFKEAESTKLLHSQYEQAMQADLSASQAKIVQQYQQLQKTKLAVQQSQDAYNMYLARYKSGLITLSELLQIRILLEQAENAHIEASREYWVLLAYEAELTADFDFLFNNL
ncbi:outer membrane efflux protein [Sphingobacterium spiritivorum ATCC 33300]|uniref:Outer membrane efflux protein n=2 Tax=Sphingobacteriaceae TaxID=84566 RepID=C2FRV0_SPHSI|nr:outer membrane efflux protein [Sphingobacterium spiritivorum ATCC 33300]QQS98087.1 TolC family protein [Sphingobacterium spiritivorum]